MYLAEYICLESMAITFDLSQVLGRSEVLHQTKQGVNYLGCFQGRLYLMLQVASIITAGNNCLKERYPLSDGMSENGFMGLFGFFT